MSENPLKQYFRRPSVFLKLPSGGSGYPQGAIDVPPNGEIPIYPMTAVDEITSRTPDALFNGTAIVEIIKSCVPNIKDPWSVTNVDLDPILVAIRAATNGSNMEIDTRCPACDETAKYDVSLPMILAGFKPGNYDEVLTINDVSFKFKPMKFTEINQASLMQFQLQKSLAVLSEIADEEVRNQRTSEAITEINNMTMELIAGTIEYIKIPTATVFEKEYIVEFFKNCDRNTYQQVKDHSVALRESTENKPLKITCSHCKHEYEQPFSINVSDFFD